MARLKGSEIFLISLKQEREVIMPLRHYYNEVLMAHIGDNTTVQQKQKEFLAACKENKVSLTAARNLARKALAKKWYCLYLPEEYRFNADGSMAEAGNYPPTPENPLEIFRIITSEDPYTPRKLSLEELVDLNNLIRKSDGDFSQAKFWKQARAVLNVPEGYVSASLWELEVLLAVQAEETRNTLTPTDQNSYTKSPSFVATPSTKETEMLFTPVHLKYLPGAQNQYKVESTGQISLFKQSLEEIAELHGQVVGFLFAMLMENLADSEVDADGKPKLKTIRFYAPDFCRRAGIDPRKFSTKRDKALSLSELRLNAIYDKIKPLETVWGIDLNGVLNRLLVIESYDKEREIITVSVPYLSSVYEHLVSRQMEEKRSQVNTLLSSTVVNEPNSAAVELATYLSSQLLQLGNYSKDGSGMVKYTIRYSTLISNCPQLQRALDKILQDGNPATRTQAYNAKLKQTFEAAYRIIFEKSDTPKRFIDLQINGVKSWKTTTGANGRKIPPNFRIPTKTQLNDKLTITHKGKNPDYQRT